jgi:predicted acylesterase/phospholipase RssA
MKCALVMTGGLAKGAFQAGVIKSFADYNLKPDVVVGASAGALNTGMLTKLIVEGNFTPEAVEENLIKGWLRETSLGTLWGEGDIRKKDTIRNIFADVHRNPFMLIKRLSNLQLDVWNRLKILFSLSFLSIFNNDSVIEMLERNMKTPEKIMHDVICAVSLTDLFAHSEYINGKPINNYSDYVTFKFKKGENENLAERFRSLREIIQASGCLPGMFPPAELDIKGNGKKRLYVDGGITKNAPFGRAIKLDPEIQYIFLVSTTPLTKPIINEIKTFPSVVGQIYEIVVTKDIVNDYRKVIQINEKIKLLAKILERSKKGKIINNSRNNDMCKLAGFHGVEDYVSKRCVEIIFIEPATSLEGDPFAAIYRKDRKYLLDSYIKHGYERGTIALREFMHKIVPPEQIEEELELPA